MQQQFSVKTTLLRNRNLKRTLEEFGIPQKSKNQKIETFIWKYFEFVKKKIDNGIEKLNFEGISVHFHLFFLHFP